MITSKELYQAVLLACQEAVQVMGEDIKTMSWFGHWKKAKNQIELQDVEKIAA